MKIVFTPEWFLNEDVLIDGFSFIVLLAFFLLCIRSYKLGRKKNFLYLGIGFGLIALAELATILTKIILYYDTNLTQNIGQAIVSYQIVRSVDIFYYIGFFFHKLLTLAGFYVVYRLMQKNKISGDFLLAMCFIVISAFFGKEFYYIFHIAALILLCLITYNYWQVYRKNQLTNTRILLFAFGLLALSQIVFLLSKVGGAIYALAQLMQLASYITLLILAIRIIGYGKKKKQNRYNM